MKLPAHRRPGGHRPAGRHRRRRTFRPTRQLSYYFGYQTGGNLADLASRGEQLDIASVIKGLQDAYGKKDPAITADQLTPGGRSFPEARAGARAGQGQHDKAAADNKTKSDAYIAQYRSQAGVKTLHERRAGTKVLTNGSGAQADHGQQPCRCRCRVRSVASARRSAGAADHAGHQAQRGRDAGDAAMRSRRCRPVPGEIALPPDMAYGADPRTGFPPNVAVVFEVTLVSVSDVTARPRKRTLRLERHPRAGGRFWTAEGCPIQPLHAPRIAIEHATPASCRRCRFRRSIRARRGHPASCAHESFLPASTLLHPRLHARSRRRVIGAMDVVLPGTRASPDRERTRIRPRR